MIPPKTPKGRLDFTCIFVKFNAPIIYILAVVAAGSLVCVADNHLQNDDTDNNLLDDTDERKDCEYRKYIIVIS